MRRTFRYVLYAAAAVLPPLAVGALRLVPWVTGYRAGREVRLAIDAAALPPAPALDAARPTVVVLLGDDATEITDALGPFEIYARAGKFNVVTAAPERRPTRFTGGLGVLPDYSLAELDARLGGRAPAVVVMPAVPSMDLVANQPLAAYLRRQAAAGAIINSWCAGAAWPAKAGLLDGRAATTHWGDIDRLESMFPRVRWRRGVRWVEDGPVVSSAGITSGIDASLHVLRTLVGDSVARRVAAEMRYPNYRYAIDPAVGQYVPRAADAVLFANGAFRTGRSRIGIALYDGVGEMDLAHIYDAHAGSLSADLYSTAAAPGVVRTAFGLMLIPEVVAAPGGAGVATLRRLHRLVVPGADGALRAAPVVRAVTSEAPALRAEYLQGERAGRFALEPVMEDLARTADLPTARFALKRVEYRPGTISLEGPAVPWRTLPLPLALSAAGLALAVRVGRRGRRTRPRSTGAGGVSESDRKLSRAPLTCGSRADPPSTPSAPYADAATLRADDHRTANEATMSSARSLRAASRFVIVAAAALATGCMMFMKPPRDIDYSRTRASEGGAYRATILPQGDSIPKGKLQRWTLHLETAGGQPVQGAQIAVDGGMPQHGHGLPTKPRVTRPLGPGDYQVDGMKFNMGGWWVVKFSVVAGPSRDSVVFNLKL